MDAEPYRHDLEPQPLDFTEWQTSQERLAQHVGPTAVENV